MLSIFNNGPIKGKLLADAPTLDGDTTYLAAYMEKLI